VSVNGATPAALRSNPPVPSSPTIRRQRPDHPQVVALLGLLDDYLASLYPPEANHILDVHALLAPEVDFFAAWSGDDVVGTAAVRRRPGEPATDGQPYGEIKRMVVAPGQRGTGLGGRLLATLEDALRGHGLRLALLETGSAQAEAVRLYERCGYSRCAAFGGYPDNGLSRFYAKVLA
jgi:putative acetyltransferase